jgi:hypothetical protein
MTTLRLYSSYLVARVSLPCIIVQLQSETWVHRHLQKSLYIASLTSERCPIRMQNFAERQRCSMCPICAVLPE